MQQPLSIIFIHVGATDWLLPAMTQARRSNPKSRVILISEQGTKVPSQCEFYDIAHYFKEAAEITRTYQHFSNYDPGFELFCFQRWMVLHEFMVKEGMSRCFHADSDVLIFSDLSEAGELFSSCDMTLSKGHCGHNAFINNREVLRSFCAFTRDILSQDKEVQISGVLSDATLQSLGMKKEIFPLNDMRLLSLFRENEDFLIGDTALILNAGTFDHDVNITQGGFDLFEGTKKFTWREGKPYGFNSRLQQEVLFHTIHFKGPAKPLLLKVCGEREAKFTVRQ